MRNLLYLLSTSILFASCDGFFDQVIEIDPPPFEKKMAVTCVVDNLDSTLRVLVTRNRGLLEDVPDSLLNLSGATVQWLEDGQVKHIFTLDSMHTRPSNWLGFGIPDFRLYGANLKMPFIKPGKAYELRVLHFDFPAVTARQTALAPVPIDSARVRIDSTGSGGNQSDEAIFTISLNDPPGEHFYEIEVVGSSGEDDYGIDSDDPNIEYGMNYRTLLLADRHFSGNKYTLRVRSEDVYSDFWTIRLRSVSRDYYQFSKAVSQNEDADYNPFASPVQVPSNIENGLGIFEVMGVSELVVYR